MDVKRTILVVGGGTAGWMAAAYLAKFLEVSNGGITITLIDSPEIGIVGVGEGTFPTIRSTLKFLGIDEALFMRETSATFKQGIRFTDWVKTPEDGAHHHFFHPFEAPFYTEGVGLLPYWLLQDEATRLPFAQAMTFQERVADSMRAPKQPHEGDYAGSLNYAYHIDALKLAELLSARAQQLGVKHVKDIVSEVMLDEDGAIAQVVTQNHGPFKADLYVDCSGFRAELIGRAMKVPFKSVQNSLFADRAITCKIPYDHPDSPIESCTVATAKEAGWVWDIGLGEKRGIGYVYSSAHTTDSEAEATLDGYVGRKHDDIVRRHFAFDAGYREKHWVKNCVAVGLSGGFLEPLEATGVVLIEVAIGMIAELFPHIGPIEAPARRFNELMAQRYDNIVNFLKLHYCLSKRTEPFWQDNRIASSIPDAVHDLLEQWKFRPPGRFDFLLDLEAFAFFNYQYILYGMGFKTDLSAGRGGYPSQAEAARTFARIKSFGERAVRDLPAHRDLIRHVYAQGFSEK